VNRQEAAQALLALLEEDYDCGQEDCEECAVNKAVRFSVNELTRKQKPLAWMYVGPDGVIQMRRHRWRNADSWVEIPLGLIPEDLLAEQ